MNFSIPQCTNSWLLLPSLRACEHNNLNPILNQFTQPVPSVVFVVPIVLAVPGRAKSYPS